MSSPELQPLTRPPRTRHLPFWVLLGGPALLATVVFLLGDRYSVGVSAQNVTMGDRPLLITIPELLDVMKSTGGYDPKAEVLKKSKLGRGGRELEYRYSAHNPPWQVASRVIAEIDPMQAKSTFVQLAEHDLETPGITLQPRDFAWGDEARLGTLLRNGAAVGSYFLGRKGNHVVLYRLEGLVLEPPNTFESLVGPHLVQAENFAP
jgi:hypothetical protein